MRIGFDVSQTGASKAGCGFYADGLIRALAACDAENEYVLYPAVGDLFWDPDCKQATFSTDQPNFRKIEAPKDFEASKSFWQNPPPDYETRLGDPQIFHANNFFCPKGLQRARLVYTLYDLAFFANPDWTTEANRLGCFAGVFRAANTAHWVVAISEYSRQDFLGAFPHYSPDRINVIYPASRFQEGSPERRSGKLETFQPGSFWLSVATIEPRKNHRALLEAYHRLRARSKINLPLVLTGGKGWLMEDFVRDIEGLELGRDVVLAGYVDDAELMWLYRNCFAFVYPSMFEGFGMPVLEAMSASAAVICSNTSSLPEVSGEAAISIDPADTGALTAAMLNLEQDSSIRARLKDLGREQAKKFSWAGSAQRLRDTYQNVMLREHSESTADAAA